MKFWPLVLALMALLGSCSSQEVGSNCTGGPIQLKSSRNQASASEIVEPLIYTGAYPVEITLGRYDAYQILASRAKSSPSAAYSASLLRPFFDRAVASNQVIDSASIYANLQQLKGKEQKEAMLVRHELMALFSTALQEGKAKVGSRNAPPPITTIQRYEASGTDGNVRGLRIMVGAMKIYDYCFTTPAET